MKMGKLRIVWLSLWALSAPCHAAGVTTEGRLYAGGILGVSWIPTETRPVGTSQSTPGTAVGTGVGYGLQAGYFLSRNVGAGAFIRSGNHDRGISPFFYGLEGLYRFTSLLPGLHAGLDLGSGRFSAGGFKGKRNLAYGARVAHDIPISLEYPLTIGLDLGVLLMGVENPVTLESKTYTSIHSAASIKVWF